MIQFYLTILAGLVAITAEACSGVAIIWTVASRGQPGFWLGLCLGGAALIPFIAQRSFPRLAAVLAEAPAKVLIFATGFGVLCALSLMLSQQSTTGLYITASLLALSHFISSQAIEMLFSISVLTKVVDAQTASRMLQMVMTFGGCFGGLVAGTLIDRSGVGSAALAASVCYALAGVPMLCLASVPSHDSSFASNSTPDGIQGHAISMDQCRILVRQSIIALIACAVSVGCFNVCLPYMASADRAWSATTYGIIDACGGVGAVVILLALGGRAVTRPWSMIAPVVFVATGILLGLAKEAALASVYALLWGIGMNMVRARARTIFFSIATDMTQAATWTSRLVLMRVVAEALAPIIAGLLLDCLSPTKSYLAMMSSCGVIVLIFSASVYFRGPDWMAQPRDGLAVS